MEKNIDFVPQGKRNVVFKLPIPEGRRLLEALDDLLPTLLDAPTKKTVVDLLIAGRICYMEHFDKIYHPPKGLNVQEELKADMELYEKVREEAMGEMKGKRNPRRGKP